MKTELLNKSIPENIENLTSQVVRLKDGRNLGYAEYGDLEGKPILYFHGSPSSRLEAAALHRTALDLNIHIISVDRPGLGLSTFQNNRSILDFADDIAQFSDALNINRFAVMGMSGGGPYVIACTYKIPERIIRAGIISGIGPIDEPGFTRNMIFSSRSTLWLSMRAPWLMEIIFNFAIARLRRNRELFFWKSVPQPDRVTLDLPIIADIWIDSMIEAFRFGPIGPVRDLGLIRKSWGFSLREINIPVQIWHGELDRNVPTIIATYLAEQIPDCKAKFFSNEGHFSLWFNHMDEILQSLNLHQSSYKKNGVKQRRLEKSLR